MARDQGCALSAAAPRRGSIRSAGAFFVWRSGAAFDVPHGPAMPPSAYSAATGLKRWAACRSASRYSSARTDLNGGLPYLSRWRFASASLCLGQCLGRLLRRCRALRYGWEGGGLRLLVYAVVNVSGAYCVVAGLCGMAGKAMACVCWFMLWTMSRAVIASLPGSAVWAGKSAACVRWLMLWTMSRALIASLPGSAVWLVSLRFAFADLRWGQCLGRLMRRCRALRYVWQASGLSGAPADAKSAAEPLEIRISAAANQKAV